MRCLFFVITILITQLISAQSEQGAVVFEGNTNVSIGSLQLTELKNTFTYQSELPNNSFKSTSLSLNAGYFIINNLSINLSLKFNYDIINYNNNIYSDGEYSYLSYGVFSRYYINNLWLWVQAGYQIGRISDYSLLDNLNYSWSSNYIAPLAIEHSGIENIPINTFLLDFGFSFFINPNISIDPTIGTTRTTYTIKNIAYINQYEENTDKLDLVLASFQFKLSIGIIFHLH
ncbi:MAG: hypothetical protein CMP49_05430 [Flavobacteriales bacterium]|nr:hypothetical protein [Flavobacteriales bacterium]|tara:strand:- start:367 stop:1059 length:693 start_codon:yes stop_codon:yes gene_type:complete